MITKHCLVCGKEFKIFPSRIGKIQCCSWECRNKHLKLIKQKQYQDNTIRTDYRKDVCILPKEMTYEGHKIYMDNDYPAIYLNSKNYHLHRYVWEQANGPIPKDMIIHHKDFNRGNWNLDNLEILTRAEHIKRHKINPINGTFTLLAYTDKTVMERSDDLL